MRNCTSFLLTQNHLIVTTTNHFLKFIHMADLGQASLYRSHAASADLRQTTSMFRPTILSKMSDAEISSEVRSS